MDEMARSANVSGIGDVAAHFNDDDCVLTVFVEGGDPIEYHGAEALVLWSLMRDGTTVTADQVIHLMEPTEED